jgi:membrane associated rhomboid family serine protease
VFPFIDTAPRAKRPIVVLTLILVNVLVFLWMWSLAPRQLEYVLAHYALIPLRYSAPDLARASGLDPHNWWPLLTNTFMHGGWLHVGFNMWFLWIFGPAMEARFGRLGFLALYIGGALAASLVHFVTHLESNVPVLGASGAIAAVIAAYSVTFPTARVITIIPIFFVPLFIPVPAVIFAGLWFLMQLLQGATEFVSYSQGQGVAWWAHIGGFAFGAIAAFLADLLHMGTQTATAVYSGPHGSRRVPDIKPRGW